MVQFYLSLYNQNDKKLIIINIKCDSCIIELSTKINCISLKFMKYERKKNHNLTKIRYGKQNLVTYCEA